MEQSEGIPLRAFVKPFLHGPGSYRSYPPPPLCIVPVPFLSKTQRSFSAIPAAWLS